MKDKQTQKKKKREQKKADRAKTLIGSQQTCPHHISVQPPTLKEPPAGQRTGRCQENPLKWSAAGNYRNRRRKGIDVARW